MTWGFGNPVLEIPITIGTKPIQIVPQQQMRQSDIVRESIPVPPPLPHRYHSTMHTNRLILQQPSAPQIPLHGIDSTQNSPMHQIGPNAPVFQGLFGNYSSGFNFDSIPIQAKISNLQISNGLLC